VPQLSETETVGVGVGHLEHERVAKGGLPSFLAGRFNELDLVVGVVEEPLEFLPGGGTSGGGSLEFLHMRGSVPLIENLGRIGAKALLADPVPTIVGVATYEVKRRTR
jgi:hypothetical protein